ncbi:MAG: ATP-dependent DNA helicase RecG, partial [Deltaproteobacteria bacterium]|nr:ATP-dependent DNA helicase RecG [Deltaproteobacteria bacterium]
MYDALKALYEPRFRVGLIHGEMPPGEKDTVMQKFHEGKIQLLVSTTVVEVGVHAPGATVMVVMVVEHPERFGLAQLHQLRGRVGRGEKQGLCLLVKRDGISGQAEKRLKVLASCDDGFVISEQDLLFRGHGEVMGLRQAGPGEIDISEVLNNQHLLMAAKEVAEKILREDPELSGQKYRYL